MIFVLNLNIARSVVYTQYQSNQVNIYRTEHASPVLTSDASIELRKQYVAGRVD